MQRETWFVIDAQLPPRLARLLTATGYRALHVTELLPATATDHEIAELANDLGAYVISKDEDFTVLVLRKILRTGLIWARFGNTDQSRLWAGIEPILGEIAERMRHGAKQIDVPFEP